MPLAVFVDHRGVYIQAVSAQVIYARCQPETSELIKRLDWRDPPASF
tara:strand:+ start:285 stop:425 length:141 start_codon:yes stop_codon:yes gene_type:complete